MDDKNKLILTKYTSKELIRKEITDIDEFLEGNDNYIKWLNIIGICNNKYTNELRDKLDLHPLVLDDLLDINQNPKVVEYKDYVFIVTKNIFYNDNNELDIEQISFLLYKDKLISFQEKKSDIFNIVLRRLKEGTYIRNNGTDHLLYGLLDSIVDNYFSIIEEIDSKIDIIEDRLLTDPKVELLEEIYKVKRELIFLRSIFWPMRNTINNLSKNEYNLINNKTIYYLRDIYDNIIQMIDITETYRDICSGMLDIYLSSIGNKTNEVMKVLTIFSTIFIPLTFLSGVYGMNLKYIPELNWRYSYLAFWIVVLIIIGLMLRYFKKKDWI